LPRLLLIGRLPALLLLGGLLLAFLLLILLAALLFGTVSTLTLFRVLRGPITRTGVVGVLRWFPLPLVPILRTILGRTTG
jgi:hypothetical protein